MLVKAPGTFSARWPDVTRRHALSLLALVAVGALVAAFVAPLTASAALLLVTAAAAAAMVLVLRPEVP